MDGIGQTIHAALATFSADNLSVLMLGGFTMSFHSYRIWCFCKATYIEMKENFNENDVVLRSTKVHKYHLKCTDSPEYKVMCGVNEGCDKSIQKQCMTY